MDLKDAHWGMRVVWTVRIRERALRFKSNARRGGFAENVFMRNVERGNCPALPSCIAQVKEAVLTIAFMYETGPGRPYKPVVRNVRLENVRSTNSPRVMWITSFPGAVIDGVRHGERL